jgi:hypothetical protein
MPIWISIIFLIIQYGPAIWKLVKQIIDMITKISLRMPQSQALEFEMSQRDRLEAAVKYYRRTGSKVRLEELHGELTCQLENMR